ncbi:hypothetical protein RSW78_26390, partial [Escherichia coli]
RADKPSCDMWSHQADKADGSGKSDSDSGKAGAQQKKQKAILLNGAACACRQFFPERLNVDASGSCSAYH